MYRLTHSLLSAWDYATGEFANEDSMAGFISTLKREPHATTAAQQKGVEFEADVTSYALNGTFALGERAKDAPDVRAAIQFGKKVRGAVPQVRARKIVQCGGYMLELVGVADFVKAGILYDTKRVGRYEYGKYVTSTQHPMYFELFPEALRFDYLIFDGQMTYIEQYRRGDCRPIQESVSAFLRDMRENGLMDIYKEHWRV